MFWDFTQRRMEVLADVSGKPTGPNLEGQAVQKMPETLTYVIRKGMVWAVSDSLRTNHRPHHFLYKLPRPYLSFPGIFIGLLTLEHEFDSLFRNVGKNQPIYTASNSKRAQISFTPRPEPETTHSIADTICTCWWPTDSDRPAAYCKPLYSFCWLVFYYKVSEKCSI